MGGSKNTSYEKMICIVDKIKSCLMKVSFCGYCVIFFKNKKFNFMEHIFAGVRMITGTAYTTGKCMQCHCPQGTPDILEVKI